VAVEQQVTLAIPTSASKLALDAQWLRRICETTVNKMADTLAALGQHRAKVAPAPERSTPREVNLRGALVGETVAHQEARSAGGATRVHEAAVGQRAFVILRLHIDFLNALERVELIYLNLVVEVADQYACQPSLTPH
jgi:hypothetical protein